MPSDDVRLSSCKAVRFQIKILRLCIRSLKKKVYKKPIGDSTAGTRRWNSESFASGVESDKEISLAVTQRRHPALRISSTGT